MSDIILKNVNFAYGKELVLEDINLNLSCKDFLAIIGPNGGGKSTLLKLILGLLKPSNGTISIFNQKPQNSKNILAYVPQNTNVNQIFPITSLEVVLMGRLNKKTFNFYKKQDYEKAYEALEKVGALDLANEHINNLSGGQRQRVYIARALCCEAKLILLDEPTASIDTDGQIKIYQLLKQLNANLGIIVVSHNINVSVGFASKIAHVNKNLFLHDNLENTTREQTLNQLQSLNHICPIEIISQTSCTHHKEH